MLTKDFLNGLGVDAEITDKIFAAHGKSTSALKKELETAKAEADKLKADSEAQSAKLKELEAVANDAEKVKEELTAMRLENEKREAKAKAKAEDDALTASVLAAIGDKQFVNDFTKNALIQEVKTAYKSDPTKGVDKAFEELTKDKEGIFTNPNQFKPSMGGIGDVKRPMDEQAAVREAMGLPPVPKADVK